MEILKLPSFPPPWCPRTCCHFPLFSTLCPILLQTFFPAAGEKQVQMGLENGGRWHRFEGGKTSKLASLRRPQKGWRDSTFPFSCSLTHPCWPIPSLHLRVQTWAIPCAARESPSLPPQDLSAAEIAPQFSKETGLQFLPSPFPPWIQHDEMQKLLKSWAGWGGLFARGQK